MNKSYSNLLLENLMFSSSKSAVPGIAAPSKHYTEAHILESQILAYSGLKLAKELLIFDVPIKFQGANYAIHTYRAGDPTKDTLVLLHGYAGCSILNYPMLKKLAEKYHVLCIDMLGMGLSSRPDFKCTNAQESINYFIDSIEAWRQAMDLKQFYLAGHSFGGYLAVHYALKYQDKVKKLFLISPAGVTKPTTTVTTEQVAEKFGYFKKKLFYKIISLWDSKTTISEYYREHSTIGGFFLKQYVSKQFGTKWGLNEKATDILQRFYHCLFKIPGGSEKAVYYILCPPRINAQIPLEELIVKGLTVPIVCYFGDKDWMDRTGAVKIQQSGQKNFKLKIVGKSGHQITMQCPLKLATDMVEEHKLA